MCQSKNEALIFFQASSFQLLKLENLLRWSFFTFRMCPYLGPVTCDYALPIEVLSRERLRGRLYVFPSLLKKIKPVIADRRFIGLYIISLRKQPTFPDMPFSGWRRKVFHLATTSAACQQAVPSRVASEASRVRTLECRKVARHFYPPSSLSLESLPFVCRSRATFHVTATISIHQLKTLLQETTSAVTSSSCKFTCWVQKQK